jgi:hypothetical protein
VCDSKILEFGRASVCQGALDCRSEDAQAPAKPGWAQVEGSRRICFPDIQIQGVLLKNDYRKMAPTDPFDVAQDFALRAHARKRLRHRSLGFARDFACGLSPNTQVRRVGNPDAPARSRPKTAQLNKTFCLLFTQKGCLFEMIIRTYLS